MTDNRDGSNRRLKIFRFVDWQIRIVPRVRPHLPRLGWALGYIFVGVLATLLGKYAVDNYYRSIVTALGLNRETPKIAVVLPLTGSDAKAAGEMRSAAELAKRDYCRGPNAAQLPCTIEFVAKDDTGVPEKAARVAKELMSDRGIIAVIGHFSSSTTEMALKEYCQNPEPVAIVMPVPTATGIVDQAHSLGCKAVLRLVPTNEQQGREAAKLLAVLPVVESQIGGNGEHMIGILRDQSNPVYSNDFGREFLNALRNQLASRGTRYSVLFNAPIGGEVNGLLQSTGMGLLRATDAVLIIGMTDLVLQSIRQAKLVGWMPGNIVLTDGALSENLITEGKNVLTDHVYLVFPLPAQREPSLKDLHLELHLKSEDISFAAYGYDSAMLLLIAVEALERQHKSLTRDQLASIISGWTENRTDIRGHFTLSDGHTFEKSGNTAHPKLGLYRYRPSNLSFDPVPGNY